MDYKVLITRNRKTDFQTLGNLFVFNGTRLLYKCKTLELPDKDNQRRISCIPEGRYKVVKRNSAKYGDHFHILDVPNRDYILIHVANYKSDLLGCIGVGQHHTDIDGDGYRDVTSSRKTMADLNDVLPNEFDVEIIEI